MKRQTLANLQGRHQAHPAPAIKRKVRTVSTEQMIADDIGSWKDGQGIQIADRLDGSSVDWQKIIATLSSRLQFTSRNSTGARRPDVLSLAISDSIKYMDDLTTIMDRDIHSAVDAQARPWKQEDVKVFEAEYIDKKISRLEQNVGYASIGTVNATIAGVADVRDRVEAAMSTLEAATEAARNRVFEHAKKFYTVHRQGLSKLQGFNLEAVGDLRINAASFKQILEDETRNLQEARAQVDQTLNRASKDLDKMLKEVRRFVPGARHRPENGTARNQNLSADSPPRGIKIKDFAAAARIAVPGTTNSSETISHSAGHGSRPVRPLPVPPVTPTRGHRRAAS